MATTTSRPHPDDIVVWPDESVATVAEVAQGDYHWKSDDYEIVALDNLTRLAELGINADAV